MRLDLVIPTFRRRDLLLRLLESVADAAIPAGLSPHILIVNNDPVYDLAPVRRFVRVSGFRIPVGIVDEPSPGKSNALNTGLALATGEYVAFLDDDEALEPSWFTVVHRELTTGRYDYIGGRSLPTWPSVLPPWLPDTFRAVLGIVDPGDTPQPYGRPFPGILPGGNAVVKLSLLRQIGGFTTTLGPRETRPLLSGEDEDLYLRLLDAGAVGQYIPDLVVYQHIHQDRLRKRYYRAWSLWNGIAKGLLSRTRRQPVSHALGVPRYLYGNAARGLCSLVSPFRRTEQRVAGELALWQLIGFLYGRYFYAEGAPEPATSAVLTRGGAPAT